MKLLTFLLLFTVKANYIVATGISCSNIPNDCKQLYLAITIKESGWHKYKKAIKYNNYSGFREYGKLKKFDSFSNYILYLENWFVRKEIKNNKELFTYIASGKYCIFRNKEEKRIYLKDILKIKKSINNYYKTLNEKDNLQ